MKARSSDRALFVFRPHLLEEGRDVRLIFRNERIDLTAQLFFVLCKCAYIGGDDGENPS